MESHDLVTASLIAVAVVVAALAHGTIGIGFPAIATPVAALVTDVRTAVVTTILPNLLINLISIVRGGGWRESLGRYWPVALWCVLGSFVGAQYLLIADPEPLKLLLALMIVAYALQERLARLDWSWLDRHRAVSGGVVGLVGGFFSGTVNLAMPPLVIYFMALGLAPIAATQVLNLCFLSGRVVQAGSLSAGGLLDWRVFLVTLPFTALAVVALYAGFAIQARVEPATYRRVITGILWVLAVVLVVQAGLWYVRRYG